MKRAAPPARHFEPGHRPPADAGFPATWCVFRAGRILVRRVDGCVHLPQGTPEAWGVTAADAHYLGALDGGHCYAAWLAEDCADLGGGELIGMRALILEADETVASIAGRAFQILEWDRTHRFCGACGAATALHAGDRARECKACRIVYYPRISPVVMAVVTRGRQILLTRKPGYAAGRYTVVAGFVEAGETLEHAVAREVMEEVGVAIGTPVYFGSQPWPFPGSLVMAFSAEYAGGDMRPDGVEIEEARWFDIDALPDLPEPVHISRQLIDAAVARVAAARLSSADGRRSPTAGD
jgi:NAD+ diphosphatase